MKVVMDTNVVVSRAVSTKGAPAKIFAIWTDGVFELVVSEDLLAEYRRALGYHMCSNGINTHQTSLILS
jgi:predicted nucleic acid-binding protein